MSESKMKEVAQLLGVDLEEEFKIEGEYGCKYKLSKNGLKYWADNLDQWIRACWLEELLTGDKKIIKLPKSILDNKEKEYLLNIVKPFRDKVDSISKRSDDNGEYITIEINEKPHKNNMFFPYFEADTMYKGMAIGKFYTLEELDL